MTKNIAAFYDIDGTFYRDSLLVEHFKLLIKHEIISPAIWHLNVKSTFNNWDKRQGNYDEYLLDLCAVYQQHLIGVSKKEVEFMADQVMKKKAERVYRYTRDQIAWHLEQGHKVIFISGSPDYLVSRMAERYNVTDFNASKYMFDEDGKYTGEVIPMWDSHSKQRAIGEFVEKYDIDLSKSFAYGDTNGDLSMMKLVGNPVAMNPARELITNMEADPEIVEKARFVVERKDMIYEVNLKTKQVTFL